jgi:ACT domain-containing protein
MGFSWLLLQTGMAKASVLIEALRVQSLLRKEIIDLAEATKQLTLSRSHFYENEFLD